MVTSGPADRAVDHSLARRQLRPLVAGQRASRICTTPAARISTPVTSARISSVRVFTAPSSRAGPAPGGAGRYRSEGTGFPRGDGYTHAAFRWSVDHPSLPT